jgi:uncharacterized protein (DUF697 family)
MGTDAEAVEKVRAALAGDSSGAAVSGSPVESAVFPDADSFPSEAFSESVAASVLVASASELASADGLCGQLSKLAESDRPVVVVLTQAPGVEVSFPGVGPDRVVGMSMDGRPPADVLSEALVDAAGDASVPLAAKLPVLREETAKRIIKKTATQNAVIGVVFILPGADMPVMTLNEAKMILQIAAAYGEEVGVERAIELLGVVGGGYGLRTLARQALDFVPGPGWIIKGAVAYSGTRAMGAAAQSYFERPARLTPSRLAPLLDRVKRLRG